MPKLIIEFTTPSIFGDAVTCNSSVGELRSALAGIVADETAHSKNGELVRFDPNRQIDIVLKIARPGELYIASSSQALCTLESYDFGDMVARKSRIARRVKEQLGIPSTENIQITLALIPDGHWERV